MNHSKCLSTRTAIPASVAPSSIVFVAIALLVILASATTPASAQAINFGSINVCPSGKEAPVPCAVSKTVTFNVPADTTIDSIAIVTTGIPDLDFQAKSDDSSSTLCKAQKYSSATSCTVDVTFAPLAPGLRKGAVELLTSKGALIASTYVYGKGVSPQLAFDPAATILLASGFPSKAGTVNTVDAAGNLYITTHDSWGVEKLLKEGNYKTIETTNLRVQPGSLVIDGAGNFFGIEQIDANEGLVGAVYEVLAAGGYKTSKIIVSGLGSDSMSLAVDGSGNLFVADNDAIAVTELLSAGDYTTSKSLGSGLDSPTSVAVDSSGNVFVADYGHNLTKEILAEGGYTTVKTLGGGPTYSYLIAIDAADNVYFTGDNGIDFVLSEILAAGGYTTIKTLSTNFVEPSTLAVDSTGNIFVTSEYNTELGETEYAATSELVRSQPPASLTFLNTPIGHTSSDSPKSVQFQNVGNATLKGTGNLLDDTNFTVVPDPV